MTYTISVNSEIRDKFLWFVDHFKGEIMILDESDDEVVPEPFYEKLRAEALDDYHAGNTVSFDSFKATFAYDLQSLTSQVCCPVF